MRRKFVLLSLAIGLALSSCSLPKTGPATPEATTTPEIFMPLPAGQRAFEAVRASLAQELGVDPLSITLVDVQPVDWPDSCLGLAGPDEMCAQVITPGFLVKAKAGETVYEFHTDQEANNIREKK